jgi:L-fucose mutarotase
VLKNLDPLLTPELLHALRSMGHGDDLVIVDANFPAVSVGQRVVRLDGVDATSALRAVLTVFPVDDFVKDAAATMAMVGSPDAIPDICAEFSVLINAAEGRDVPVNRIERFAFYQRARSAYVVVQTGERRLYGNVILTKGVVRER